jgi:hypothetical protein
LRFAALAGISGVAVTVGLASLAWPGFFSRENECTRVESCTSLVGPWTPVVDPDSQTGGWSYSLRCREQDAWATGWDGEFSGTAEPEQAFLWADANERDATGGEWVVFQGVGQTAGSGETFRPRLGCSTSSSAPALGRSLAQPGVRMHVKEVGLDPHEKVTVRHACREDERMTKPGGGVGFFTEEPPSRAKVRQVESEIRKKGRGLRATVRTGRRVGDDEEVRLQLGALCVARG